MNRFVLSLLTGGVLTLSVFCQNAARAQAPPRRLTPPPGSVSFGASVTALANGNIVVTDPDRAGPGDVEKAGAVYLYDGATLEIISTLTGSHAGDRVGCVPLLAVSAVTELPSGNYLVRSEKWNDNRGAVTWCSGTAGLSGQVSSANSLTGGSRGDLVGDGYQVEIFPNGNYAVRSLIWNESRGAVTWGSGTAGVTGEVSPANSLTGMNAGDRIGRRDPWHLANGNCLWFTFVGPTKRGALTLMNTREGTVGEVSAANSLVGLQLAEYIRPEECLTVLDNGNFVIRNPLWNRGMGAVTWGSGTAGVRGEISAANSLIGEQGLGFSIPGIGAGGVFKVGGGNYAVLSPGWSRNRGAVTWGDGTKGVTGEISAENSLVGPALPVSTGAATTNMTVLANGNAVASFPNWNERRGAAVWFSGAEGVKGEVSAAHALTGAHSGDEVGLNGVTALPNGNYVVSSPFWSGSGASTWGNGLTGLTGVVSAANSLIGPSEGDRAGDSVTVLSDGNYVVVSPWWGNRRGAVTWVNGATGMTGGVTGGNSLIGTLEATAEPLSGDRVGRQGVLAVTWVKGGGPTAAEVSAANSLTGTPVFDGVGSLGVSPLANGDYVVSTPRLWHGGFPDMGAWTWGGGAEGVRGEISAANSLLATDRTDVGNSGLTVLAGGAYAVRLPALGTVTAVRWCAAVPEPA